jgi:hypothetical protein
MSIIWADLKPVDDTRQKPCGSQFCFDKNLSFYKQAHPAAPFPHNHRFLAVCFGPQKFTIQLGDVFHGRVFLFASLFSALAFKEGDTREHVVFLTWVSKGEADSETSCPDGENSLCSMIQSRDNICFISLFS